MPSVKRIRTVTLAPPAEQGHLQGLAYALWMPSRPRGGVVILHGAGSAKENHFDFARAAHGAGFAAVCFDQRGHGVSEGPLDDRAGADVGEIAALLRGMLRAQAGQELPIALRGSSMGGYLALVAAEQAQAAAVVAICPAPGELLRRGLSEDRFDFTADKPALDRFLAEHDLHTAAAALSCPVLLLHAEGDESVPVQASRELAGLLRHPQSRLIAVPGGHHRSIQHDGELQATSLLFLARALR
jgi:pimeloyl-ACP methyl ester carboxylesterase